MLFRLNLHRSRRAGGEIVGEATFNARAIKVEEVCNQQRMFPYGFLVRIEFGVINRLRDSRRFGGEERTSRRNWHYRFIRGGGFRLMPCNAINTGVFLTRTGLVNVLSCWQIFGSRCKRIAFIELTLSSSCTRREF